MFRTSPKRTAVPTEPVARVLVVTQDDASRLTLQSVLEAAGYEVKTASHSEDAEEMLHREEFALVLSELDLETAHAGLEVLAFARMLENPPATGVISGNVEARGGSIRATLLQNVPELVGQVAEMISGRASRLMLRDLAS
jgi:CheY-like chemotaxis protein